MKQPTTWYVIADGGRARILQRRETRNGFDRRREMVSADIHRHTHELGTERPGRTRDSAMSSPHAVEPREDLHRAAKRSFVHNVAAVLNEANTRNEFDRLVLVAPAHALTELHSALDAPTGQRVAAELQKDLTNVPDGDLAKHLIGLDGA